METFGSFLREKREDRKGFSLNGLSRLLKQNKGISLSISVLDRWETGERLPTNRHRSKLIALAEVLDCTEKEKARFLDLAKLSPLTREDYDVDKHLHNLKKRWQQTQFLCEVMKYSNADICQKLEVNEIQVEKDLAFVRGRESAGESTSSLILTVDDHVSKVIDQKTKREANLLKFTLATLLPSNLIVTDKICLEVDNIISNEEVRRSSIGARMMLSQYRVELELNQGNIIVTTDTYKYAGRDLDQFEIMCTSLPGFTYCVRVVVYYTKPPKRNKLSLCSDDILLRFPKEPDDVGSMKHAVSDADDGTRHDMSRVIVGEDSDGKLERLTELIDEPASGTETDLRLFFERDLTAREIKGIKKQIGTKEIMLSGQVTYGTKVLIVPFKYSSLAIAALSGLSLHDLIGWQLINT
ncbi:MAG: helix-turn-helix domain-containing protein, partial [Planctomycetes bacterium]|nr:helix-turn-helix domain-containing protein [Planctomycetota bacterium]